MSEQTPIWMWEIINVILPWKRPPTGGRKMSEPGDIARQKLHDLRWGPHIEDDVERQETLDEAIGAALDAIRYFEAKLEAVERLAEEAVPMVVECYQTWPESAKGQPKEWLSKMGRLE